MKLQFKLSNNNGGTALISANITTDDLSGSKTSNYMKKLVTLELLHLMVYFTR